ncbi:MAG: hypothetical protein IJD39_10800 [Clostridia bacterium]|nr:hypothetical protein [Clostridia bacterium]
MKKHKSDALARLKNWLEYGDDPLEVEMEEALGEEEAPPIPAEEDAPEWEEREDRKALAPKKEKHPLYDKVYRIAAEVISLMLIAVLLYAAVHMPNFGGADTLVNSEVSAFYVENTLEETGAVNIITGIILDYRGFDTLGESHVLFIGICTVLLLMSIKGEKDEEQRIFEDAYDRHFEPRHDEILQTATRILTPLIVVFGIYIIVNGHLSPGGGFSGGAVLGAGLILYQNAFGYLKVERIFTFRTFKWVSACSLLFYSLAKGYHFFTGANHLESGIHPGVAGNIFSAGLLLPLNAVVGLVVACTMYALYTMFRRGDF